MVLAEAVACAKANRGKTARGPSSLWAGQSGTHGTICLLAAETFLNLISHSSSVSTVQGVALLPDHLEQRMPHVPRAMCPRGTFLQTLFVLVPLKSIVFTHLPLAAALKSDFHVYPGDILSSPPPRTGPDMPTLRPALQPVSGAWHWNPSDQTPKGFLIHQSYMCFKLRIDFSLFQGYSLFSNNYP